MSMDALTTGQMMYLSSNSNSTGTRVLSKVHTTNAAATGTTTFCVHAAAGRGLFIDTDLVGGGYALEIDAQQQTSNTAKIDSAATTGTILEIVGSGVLAGAGKGIDLTVAGATTGIGLNMSMAGLTTGKMVSLTSAGTLAGAGRIIDIVADAATTGTGISASMNLLTTGGILDISSSSTATNPRALATITQSGDVTTSGDTTGLKLAMTSGRGIFIDSDDANGAPAFEIDSEHATTNAVSINATTTSATGVDMAFGALTTGTGLDIRGTAATMGTAAALVEIQQTNALGAAANVATLSVATAGNGAYGVKISSSHATSNASLRIDSTTTTKNIVEVVGNALTSGDGMQVSSSAAHTGQLISLTSTNTADTARGEALHIQYNTANTSAIAMKIANSSATSFSVSQAGDVVMGGNLSILGTTTEINTTTTVARDTAIVLGAQSAIVTGAIYTAATQAVVTSTAHGLTNGQVIFVVASSGTAIVSEQLVKVANKTTNTFEVVTIADVVISGTGDSTTRTFSWTGPQTDAAVDDAGIIIPGDTAIHTIKWDNTDNYWELNDSTMINSTGQFVFPKGTAAQQPASSASATLAAATPGAQRYNTDNAKFEGVTSGTTWENMSSEAFAVAVSIALG